MILNLIVHKHRFKSMKLIKKYKFIKDFNKIVNTQRSSNVLQITFICRINKLVFFLIFEVCKRRSSTVLQIIFICRINKLVFFNFWGLLQMYWKTLKNEMCYRHNHVSCHMCKSKSTSENWSNQTTWLGL